MKKLFMPLILMILTDPVMANQVTSSSECLQMYRNYLNDHSSSRSPSRSEIKNYLENCMPAANPVNNDEPLHRKLLQIVDEEQNIITVKA